MLYKNKNKTSSYGLNSKLPREKFKGEKSV
jgi:hypothetical protein